MNKLSWGAGAGQGRRDFATDMSTFTHTAHDDSAISCGENANSLGKALVDAGFESVHRPHLNIDGSQCRVD